MSLKTIAKTSSPCLRCGFAPSDDSRAVCPLCLPRKQSLTHLGLSNAIEAPCSDRQAARVNWVAAVVLVVIIVGFGLALHRENVRQAQLVERMERLR
jgi:hypothetical protein